MQRILDYFPQLTPHQRTQLEQLDPLYREWNERINVISRKDIDQLYEHLQTMSSTPAEPAESPTVETTDVDQLNENELDQLIASLESDV